MVTGGFERGPFPSGGANVLLHCTGLNEVRFVVAANWREVTRQMVTRWPGC